MPSEFEAFCRHPMTTISFTCARRQFALSDDDVRARAANHQPDPIELYWVDIDGVSWPCSPTRRPETTHTNDRRARGWRRS